MTNSIPVTHRKWFYPAIYVALLLISMMPLYAEKPYLPQNTQDVIIKLLMVATAPFAAYAPIFHIATLLVIVFIVYRPGKLGRLVAGYIGLNYLIIAGIETMGYTEEYGFVVHTGALIAYFVLGITWLVVAAKNELVPTFKRLTAAEYGLLLLAGLAFWAPYTLENGVVQPRFDPLFLLTSPDYGMTFCLTTPIFLLGLIMFYPLVNPLAYRITAFNGLIYGLFNMTHWFSPDTRWMGFLHLPLLIISGYAILLPRISKASGVEQSGPGKKEAMLASQK